MHIAGTILDHSNNFLSRPTTTTTTTMTTCDDIDDYEVGIPTMANADTAILATSIPIQAAAADDSRPCVTMDSNKKERQQSCDVLVWLTLLVSVLVVAALVAVIVLAVGIRKTTPNTSPNEDDESTYTPLIPDQDYFTQLYTQLLPEVPELVDPTSPSYQALQWMSFTDRTERFPELNHAIRQRFALIVFYYSTGGETFWNINSWLQPTQHECTFSGISCDSANVVVVRMDFRNRSLIGQLPSTTLVWLTNLHGLDLAHNRVGGTLPSRIFDQLTKLIDIDISFNEFTGNLPSDWSRLSQLRVFRGPGNYLTGRLPETLPRSMERMQLETNRALQGTIPHGRFAETPNLRALDVSGTQLTGTLPPVWNAAWPTTLESFKISETKLVGTLPSQLGGLARLEQLDVSWTGLTGTFPTELVHLTSLREFVAVNTKLEGDFFWNQVSPAVLAGNETVNDGTYFPVLSFVDLTDSFGLEGRLPPDHLVRHMTSLRGMELNGLSGLYGSIPSAFGELPTLQRIFAISTSLTGTLPPSMCEPRTTEQGLFNMEIQVDCLSILECTCCYCHGT